MKITVDTDVFIRAAVRDHEEQARIAAKALKQADYIAVSHASLCEFVWVLRRVYQFGHQEIAATVEALLDAGNVAVNRPAAEFGLAVLRAGDDFADGLIAYEGDWLGGEVFVSFDKKAVAMIAEQGKRAELLM